MPGPVVYVPSRVGEGYFTDWQAPVSGDNGKVWAYNHGTGKFEPYTIPTVAPGGSSGYIQYNNTGSFGASGVYWDSVNSRVGIGMASPAAPLHILNSTNLGQQLYLQNTNGNQTGTMLWIKGGNSTSDDNWSGLRVRDNGNNDKFNILGSGKTGIAGSANTANTLTVGTSQLIVTTSGNVGIGTTSPGQKLDVNGSVNVATALVVPVVRPAADSTSSVKFTKADGTTSVFELDTVTGRIVSSRNEVQYDSGLLSVTLRPTLTSGYSVAAATQIFYNTSMSYGGSTISANAAMRSEVIAAQAANVTWAAAWISYIDVRNTATLTNVASILIPDVAGVAAGATLTNVYGIYVASQTKGTNKYSIYTNAGDIRLMSSNSDKIGFHGVTPVARQLLATGAGRTVDDVITFLQNLGLARQS